MAHGVDVQLLAYSVMLILGETNFIIINIANVDTLLMFQVHSCVYT